MQLETRSKKTLLKKRKNIWPVAFCRTPFLHLYPYNLWCILCVCQICCLARSIDRTASAQAPLYVGCVEKAMQIRSNTAAAAVLIYFDLHANFTMHLPIPGHEGPSGNVPPFVCAYLNHFRQGTSQTQLPFTTIPSKSMMGEGKLSGIASATQVYLKLLCVAQMLPHNSGC